MGGQVMATAKDSRNVVPKIAFNAGEVSPYLRGRVDLQKFQQGAHEMTNFFILPQGPITRRAGTVYQTLMPESPGADIPEEEEPAVPNNPEPTGPSGNYPEIGGITYESYTGTARLCGMPAYDDLDGDARFARLESPANAYIPYNYTAPNAYLIVVETLVPVLYKFGLPGDREGGIVFRNTTESCSGGSGSAGTLAGLTYSIFDNFQKNLQIVSESKAVFLSAMDAAVDCPSGGAWATVPHAPFDREIEFVMSDKWTLARALGTGGSGDNHQVIGTPTLGTDNESVLSHMTPIRNDRFAAKNYVAEFTGKSAKASFSATEILDGATYEVTATFRRGTVSGQASPFPGGYTEIVRKYDFKAITDIYHGEIDIPAVVDFHTSLHSLTVARI